MSRHAISEPAKCPCCGGPMNIPNNVSFFEPSGTVASADWSVILTAQEASLFAILWRRRNSEIMFSREKLHNQLYGRLSGGGPSIKVVEVMIHKIRKKLEAVNATIEILHIWHRGYLIRERQKGQKFQKHISSASSKFEDARR